MALNLTPKNITPSVSSKKPIPFVLIDHSGADTILTVHIPGHPPVTHAFSLREGRYQEDVVLAKGTYACTFVIQVIESNLNKMYDCALEIDSKTIFTASGNITSNADSDLGFFQLTVV